MLQYPQDVFQFLSSVIYKIFFKLLPIVSLEFHLKEQLPQGAIYIATHQSNLDYPILGSFIKKYLTVTNLNFTKIPFASYVGKLIGARAVNQNNLGEIAVMYKELEDILYDNRNVIIFPEGTRGDGKTLGKFKKGAFRLAMVTRRPLIPIIIDGSSQLLAKGDPCFKTLKKTVVKVTMLDPIYPENFNDITSLLEYTQQIMEYKHNQ
jgi:1-acyl-sn-glycerol-3-phosphate acyltransferase